MRHQSRIVKLSLRHQLVRFEGRAIEPILRVMVLRNVVALPLCIEVEHGAQPDLVGHVAQNTAREPMTEGHATIDPSTIPASVITALGCAAAGHWLGVVTTPADVTCSLVTGRTA